MQRWFGRMPALLLAASLEAGLASGGDPPAFRVYVREPGVYRVTHEDLRAAGLPAAAYPSRELALANRGEPVPLWMEDGGDGSFGPGDAFEFVGERLPGDVAYYHEFSPHNVFQLRWDAGMARRMTRPEPGGETGAGPGPAHLSRRLHLEEDRLLIRIESFSSPVNQAETPQPETWFWAKLSHIDAGPLLVPLDLPGLDAGSGRPVSLRIHFLALSRPWTKPEGVADHRVTASVAGRPLGATEWDGKTEHLWELEVPEPAILAGDTAELALRVPARAPADGAEPLVDLVMLNWVEVRYPHTGAVGARPVRLEIGAGAPGALLLPEKGVRDLVAYEDGGARIEAHVAEDSADGPPPVRLPPSPRARSVLVVPGPERMSPERVELDRPSRLREPESGADYLMIAHGSLLEAARPLAELHRRRGLRVTLVDVQDVYDEFQHGIVHPRGIRSFLEHAYHRWPGPPPRFVLLIGDASWDSKNTQVDDANYANWSNRDLLEGPRFTVKESQAYRGSGGSNDRGLVPTWSSWTPQGHAASDNFYAAVDGMDYLPDMAIGRFPVRDPEEVSAIVAKISRYVEAPVGPWRRRVLWITNEEDYSQQLSNDLATARERRGFSSEKVYPRPEESGNEEHQARLRQAFDEGQLLVHFYGHGGRYIWRTGPPDYRKNHDLFTLDDLDELAPNPRLPVVLSMTCFTAPFDHPDADSIGEKFLRLPDRGAIAVLGASWRNAPSPVFSRALVDQLTRPGTIGEAVLRAKVEARDRIMVETYNLLGDPALPIAAPDGTIRLEVSAKGPAVHGFLDEGPSSGRALIEWLDRDGSVLQTNEIALSGPELQARFRGHRGEAAKVAAVRAYAWDEVSGRDAVGRADLALAAP